MPCAHVDWRVMKGPSCSLKFPLNMSPGRLKMDDISFGCHHPLGAVLGSQQLNVARV